MIVELLVIFICFIVCDIPMIGYFNKNMYIQHYQQINGNGIDRNKEGYITKFFIGFFIYLVLAFSIYYFVLYDKLKGKEEFKKSMEEIFVRGCVLGFCIYFVFNGTNKFTIEKYGWKESIIDTVWGTFLVGLVSLLSFLFLYS